MLSIVPFQKIYASRYLMAVIAGLTMAAAFPKIELAGGAWIAPALMLLAAVGKRGSESFRVGYVAGFTHYLASLYWLLFIPYRWHSIPLGPATGWVALSAFMALFPATWVWVVLRLAETRVAVPTGATLEESEFPRLSPVTASVLAGGWSQRALWTLSGACLWVAMEMVINRIFGGFPWDLLGVSQYRLVPLLQIASVTGVYGISFLVVWFSLSLFSAGALLIRRPGVRQLFLELALPGLVIALLFSHGLHQIRHAPPETRSIKLALIQPSIPQTLIWDETKDDERFQELLRLTEAAATNGPDLIVWPEAAVPKLLRYDHEVFERITGLAKSNKVWMILGADDAEPKSDNPKQADYFNSSFLISPEGKVADYYQKRALVIFGEYLPLARWLPFLKWFTPIEGGFTPGKAPSRFRLGNLDILTSVLICYEDIFPQVARSGVTTNTDFLVNITNDGWFGEGAAQWQQAMTALLRTVENRVPLIRCTNNGITCWIDAYGRVRQVFRDFQGSVYGKGFALWELPLPERRQSLTFYTRYGDVFGWSCTAISALLIAIKVALGRRREPGTS